MTRIKLKLFRKSTTFCIATNPSGSGKNRSTTSCFFSSWFVHFHHRTTQTLIWVTKCNLFKEPKANITNPKVKTWANQLINRTSLTAWLSKCWDCQICLIWCRPHRLWRWAKHLVSRIWKMAYKCTKCRDRGIRYPCNKSWWLSSWSNLATTYFPTKICSIKFWMRDPRWAILKNGTRGDYLFPPLKVRYT